MYRAIRLAALVGRPSAISNRPIRMPLSTRIPDELRKDISRSRSRSRSRKLKLKDDQFPLEACKVTAFILVAAPIGLITIGPLGTLIITSTCVSDLCGETKKWKKRRAMRIKKKKAST